MHGLSLDTPNELLDDVCHMESRIGVLRDSISFSARYMHGVSYEILLRSVWRQC